MYAYIIISIDYIYSHSRCGTKPIHIQYIESLSTSTKQYGNCLFSNLFSNTTCPIGGSGKYRACHLVRLIGGPCDQVHEDSLST